MNYLNNTYIVNLKHGSNLTIHSLDMPLIALNSNIIIR